MKAILAILLFFTSTIAFASNTMVMPIDKIYDGDTIQTHIAEHRLPSPLNLLAVRINGIDSPEMPASSYSTTGKLGRSKCAKEAELAIKAKQLVVDLAKGQTKMKVINYQWDKFGGRILGDIIIGDTNVAEYLIAQGVVIPYHGEAKTHDWCE